MPHLRQTLQLGELTLPNRIIMAPLTRSRAAGTDGRVPNALMREYYVQRASAGLILTEATIVSARGAGYANTPGIYTAEQVQGWRQITQAVHGADGRIFLQLWHVGRVSDPLFLDGALPVAPSAITFDGHVSLVRPPKVYVTPHALTLSEIKGVVEEFRQGAINAKNAGFDGVEIHGANGYLLDQFLQSKSNLRTDAYGGCLENRARFMLEIADAVISVWGAGRVGMHLAPRGDAHGMGDANPEETFSYVAQELGRRKIAFICAREYIGPNRLGPTLKKKFGGVYIVNEGFTRETAENALAAGEADAVAFGRTFLANPDLPRRFEEHAPLNAPRPDTFYSPGADGYINYPRLP